MGASTANPLKFYGYDRCDTCRRAKKWLHEHAVTFQDIDITASPPTQAVLRTILAAGNHSIKNLFNRAGQVYRQLNLKDRLPSMTEQQALDLLASNGRLIKRPIMTDGHRHTIGFDPKLFDSTWI
jgi:arsenate reductase